ncbi:RnfH family protein [Ramlibacter tataouinensis]|uniref:RnfH family protein n=1 Tax=Ramlibacter tataouinensis TaxID=94132 RepID=UPI0022F3CC90|nr:RnfH family protein [Ramlibacter tataouinensis]WBY02044.1 RnfH family protein [Ramlibacter tataouinensis]
MADAALRVTVLHSPGPREVREQALRLPAGATVADALRACGLAPGEGEAVGVWGRKAGADQPLRDRDRVEVARPLRVDPKLARRERFQRQGSRGAGLFANRRPGSKAGY